MKVLFVCSGNICRSPMAAEYFRDRATRSGLSHVVVDSGGTLGIEGSPASADAVKAMEEIGVDLTHHRSRGLTAQRLATTDLVIGMAREHLEWIAWNLRGGPDARWILRAFEKRPLPDHHAPDLADPIGQPLEFYREQREILTRSLDHLVLHIKHGS